MCTHNGARFVETQLASILDQTLPPAEIVLSDDASSDDTVRLAQELVERHEGTTAFRVMHNPKPLGVTKNFEQAILATTGELIALCDQDDVWHPERLERIAAEFASRPNLTLLHGDARLVDEAGDPLGGTLFEALEVSQWERERISSGNAIDALIRRNLVTGATAVFRRTLLDRAVPFPVGWVHDEWLAIIAASTGIVDFIEQPLVNYRQHSANQIGASKLSFAGKVRRMLEPRRARNERLEANFTVLAERLANLDGVPDRVKHLALEKRDHEIARNAYPASRWRRPRWVAREYHTGRYALSAHGVADVVRDLLQRAD
jgi:glycosyltransferase involved in cell wall biosynthesis